MDDLRLLEKVAKKPTIIQTSPTTPTYVPKVKPPQFLPPGGGGGGGDFDPMTPSGGGVLTEDLIDIFEDIAPKIPDSMRPKKDSDIDPYNPYSILGDDAPDIVGWGRKKIEDIMMLLDPRTRERIEEQREERELEEAKKKAAEEAKKKAAEEAKAGGGRKTFGESDLIIPGIAYEYTPGQGGALLGADVPYGTVPREVLAEWEKGDYSTFTPQELATYWKTGEKGKRPTTDEEVIDEEVDTGVDTGIVGGGIGTGGTGTGGTGTGGRGGLDLDLMEEAKRLAAEQRKLQEAQLLAQLGILDESTARALGMAELGAVGMGMGLEESQRKYGISGGLALAGQQNLQAQIAQQLGGIYGQQALMETQLKGEMEGLPAQEQLNVYDMYSMLLGLEGQELSMEQMQAQIDKIYADIAAQKSGQYGQSIQNKILLEELKMMQQDPWQFYSSLVPGIKQEEYNYYE